jgi:hypothetical protein
MSKLMRTKRPSHCLCRTDTINLSVVLLRDFLTTAYLALQATDPLPYWVFFNKAADTNATLVHDDMTGIKWRFPRMVGTLREWNACTEITTYSNQPEATSGNGSDGPCHFYQLETGNTCTTDGTDYTDQSRFRTRTCESKKCEAERRRQCWLNWVVWFNVSILLLPYRHIHLSDQCKSQ